MKIALIIASDFSDYELLEKKLNKLKVTEVISGTTSGYKMLEKYIENKPDITISIAKKGENGYRRAVNSINESDNVIIFANGNGNRSERSINYAINKNKNLKVYSYKSKAFDITTDKKYINISLEGNLKKTSQHEGLFLNKEETQNLINNLKNSLKDLT